MRSLISVVFALVLLLGLTAYPQQRQLVQEDSRSEKRVALVIGNSAYPTAPLKNPINDAQDMAQALRGLGFDVIYRENLNQSDMKRAIREFGAKIRTGGVGLFYYAGHGVAVKGINYLVPVDAQVESEEEVEYECVDAGFVLAQMDSAGNRLNIVILDACRNNPFARSFRATSRGLAQMDAPSGTLIAYATAPGSVASDGNGRNGLYTQELLKYIRMPNLGIEEVFKRVRISVRTLTQLKQTPWESSSLTGDFYFTGPSAAKGNPPPNTEAAKKPVNVEPASSPLNNSNLGSGTHPPATQTNQSLASGANQSPNINYAIVSYIRSNMPAMLTIIGTGWDATSEIKVVVNGQDVTTLIDNQNFKGVQLKGTIKDLNLRDGTNELFIISNGIRSNTVVFKKALK
jgi:Caspase domain